MMVKLLSILGFLVLVGCIDPPPQNAANNVTTNNVTPRPTGVGSACRIQADCDGYCSEPGALGIPGGYCTKFCSRDGMECPDGSHCGLVDSDSGFGVCLSSCEDESDCGREGFGCLDNDLDRSKECWPLANGEGELADPCESTNDCGGGPGAFCLSPKDGFSDGYCSKGCGSDTDCAGGTCLDQSACAAKECNGREGYKEYAIEFNDRLFEFCWVEGTAKVGDQCKVDIECEAEDAICIGVLPGGYCTKGCVSNMDCGEGAVCVKGPEGGLCLATCDENNGCRGGYVCTEPLPTIDGDDARFCFAPPDM